MKNSLIPSYLYAFTLAFASIGQADIAIIAGQGLEAGGSDAISYPLAKSLSIGKQNTSSINVPLNPKGELIAVAINSYTGNILFTGISDDNFLPLAYTGSVVSSSVNAVSFPSDTEIGYIVCAAFDTKGNSVLGGITNPPSAYRLSAGASQVTSIELPNLIEGELNAVAFFSNNTAVFVGQDYTSSSPLIYLVPEGASQAILVSLPDPSIIGKLNCIAIGPDGTAILGGHDFTNHRALIYRLTPGSLTANAISVPDTSDEGRVYTVRFTSNGTAILGGRASSLPLIYQIFEGETFASIIANPNGNEGFIQSLAIGSDNIAIMVGSDGTTNLPLIYRLSPGASQATSIPVPSPIEGSFNSVAIGSKNVAVLVGGSYDGNAIIYTLSTTDTIPSPISFSNPFPEGSFLSVFVYSFNGLYDIRRIRPYDYLELDETKNSLRNAGL